MWQRGIVTAGLVAYLAVVLGCVLTGAQTSKIDEEKNFRLVAAKDLPYRGVAMQIQRTDWIEEYKKCVDEIVELGADTFLCIVDARQENGSSQRIYLDMRMTPTPTQLADLIGYAKQKKLRVILMPIVLLDNPRGGEWRGTIDPPSWSDWFESYRAMMSQYAWIAQANNVDVLVVGSELVSSEKKAEEWTKTISLIRDNYKGQLTYSSNWDHYADIPFWEQLDIIGMNSYWKLGKDRNVTVAEVADNWKGIQKDLRAFCSKKNKPLLFLEVGWCSIANAASEPWDYTKIDASLDMDLQRKLWEGFFEAWHGDPMLAGFMVWAWAPRDGGLRDKGYTPKGKPSYTVIKNWLAKPWVR